MNYIFKCLNCGHIHNVTRQKYVYFLGRSCEKCKGPLIEIKIKIDLAKGNDFSVLNGEAVENK